MSNSPTIRLGTRGSALARWQADWVTDQLTAIGVHVELIVIETTGDVTGGSIAEIGGQGVFTKEIQNALLDNRIDLAVHSLKDLPTETIEGLTLAAVPQRESNRDVLVSGTPEPMTALSQGAKIGTGSARRRAHLLYHRGDLQVEDIRGNVDTRLRKLDEGEFDAIVLAEAGLKRLGFQDRITQLIDLEIMLPAVGQGALGLECRADDETTQGWVGKLNHTETHAAVTAERSLLKALRAGCLAPVGAWARVEGDTLHLDASVLPPDGASRLDAKSQTTDLSQASQLGSEVAQTLIDQGAMELINSARNTDD